jgi:AAA+ superfamily predicted ATPase
MSANEAQPLPFAITADQDDTEVAALIESWRYRGPTVSWDAVVGHTPQVRRCQEVVEAMRRPADQLARLRIRLGSGIVLAGPAGTGKTLLAKAVAGAVGRDVIAPPVSELTPGLIARLYAQLARMDPVVVVLDEAERVICNGFGGGDEDLVRALCVALDGLERPNRAPITLALTTANEYQLSPTATRPGRLSPRLDLGLPTPDERRILLDRAIDGLPVVGTLDVALAVERTGGWSGAEIAVAVEEVMSRSLLDHTDALTSPNLLAIVGERYVISDPSVRRLVHAERTARHEAAHALYAHSRWPGAVAMVSLRGEQPGLTRLDEERLEAINTAGEFRSLAGMALAGLGAEMVLYGAAGASSGASRDQVKATEWLIQSREATLPYDRDVLERGHESDRGSERMRAALHAAVEDDGARLLAEVIAELAPRRSAIESLAGALLAADDLTLSGSDLETAINEALDLATVGRDPLPERTI